MKKLRLIILLIFLFTFINKIYSQGTWSDLGSGIPPRPLGVLALCSDTVNNVLYAGGAFDTAGSVQQNSLAKWDGAKWDTTVSINSGTYVYALIMYHGSLIIGFSNGNVGEYDGSSLTYLPGFNGAAYCFYIYNDTLYAGGEFYKSDNTVLNCVAKWNGTKWLSVDKGFSWYDCCVEVSAMVAYNGELIAAGVFDSAGSIAATSIAAYNGNKWKSLGINLSAYGIDPYNVALETYQNRLYVIGNFDSVNSVYTTCKVISWDGINCDTVFSNTGDLGGGSPATIKMKSFDGYLFVSGLFNNQIPFKYDGDAVSTVDSGVSGNIYAMTVWDKSLYVGGNFDFAVEAKPHTPGVARWTPDSTTTVANQSNNTNERLTIFPNPTSNQLTFSSSSPIEQLQIEDVLGQTVLQNSFTPQPPKGGDAWHVDVSALPQGIYFYRVTDANSQIISGKFIKE